MITNRDIVAKIDYSLNNDSPQDRERRIEFVRNETWESRFRQMVDVVERDDYRSLQ